MFWSTHQPLTILRARSIILSRISQFVAYENFCDITRKGVGALIFLGVSKRCVAL